VLLLLALPVATLAKPGEVSIIASPAHSHVGEHVELSWEFELGGSFDPKDWVAAEQKWDLDGDGKYDDATGSTATLTFAKPGTHTVGIDITYECGFNEKIRRKIEVLAATPPSPAAPAVAAPPPPPPPPATPVTRQPPAVAPPGIVAPEPASTVAATAAPRKLTPTPVVRMRGLIRGHRVRVTELSVRTQPGSLVRVTCRGAGCPIMTIVTRARSRHALRLRIFERRIAPGTVLDVVVTMSSRIGKYTRFTFRRGKTPLRTDACAAAGSGQRIAC
jgi:hypothetical protein